MFPYKTQTHVFFVNPALKAQAVNLVPGTTKAFIDVIKWKAVITFYGRPKRKRGIHIIVNYFWIN